MKNAVIFTMAIFIIMQMLNNFCIGQNNSYLPMLNEDAVWFETYTNYSWPPSPYGYNTCGRKYLAGDTVINSLSYKKIYHESLDVFCTDIILEGPEYAGAIREDIDLQQVWYIYPTIDLEILYFDFSSLTGDTISNETFFGSTFNWFYEVIAEVDTIITLDGVERRRWIFDADPYADESFLIEGLGCSSGLLAPYEVLFEYSNHLANFHIDTTLIYCSDYIGCELPTDTCITVSIEDNCMYSASNLLLFPNPVCRKNPVQIRGLPQVPDDPLNVDLFNISNNSTTNFLTKNSDLVFTAPDKAGVYVINIYNSKLKKQIKLIVK